MGKNDEFSRLVSGNLVFENLKPNDLKTNPIPISHQKVISNQELNSLDSSHNSGKIILPVNPINLKF